MIKVLDIEEIRIVSLNQRHRDRNFYLTKEYREFKEALIIYALATRAGRKIEPPYKIIIKVECYADYDNILKPIHDALENVGWIDNDKNILDSHVVKVPTKRGAPGKLQVWLDHYGPETT